MGTIRAIAAGLVAAPVMITCMDVFGYVAKVEGASMQPCLNPDPKTPTTDYVFLNRWKVRSYEFTRGEVVSLTSPTNPDQKIIKRIIGLEGDKVRTLSYKNRNIKVPKGHCWVEGDHHGQSLDSNLFGPVAMGLILAKASHIVWPPSRWQRLEAKMPSGRVSVRKDFHNISDISNKDLNIAIEEVLDES